MDNHNGFAVSDFPVCIPATYKTTWDDGFGARGWKLDVSIGDPAVIASTAETGNKIPTSVLVHDMLDHYLCGLPMSGHRNEAIALCLLQERTDSDPAADFTQMVEEDIMYGKVNGEGLVSFLPAAMLNQIPLRYRNNDQLTIGYLAGEMGEAVLKQALVERFFELGAQGRDQALMAWRQSQLNFDLRKNIGLCLQQILSDIDELLIQQQADILQAEFCLSNQMCGLKLAGNQDMQIMPV